jgi:phosphoribosylformylglycinamidine cyclo-ligase
MPTDLEARIDLESFTTPEIFFEIQRRGRVAADEMTRVFNCGLGMVVCVDGAAAADLIALSAEFDVHAQLVGEVVAGSSGAVVS